MSLRDFDSPTVCHQLGFYGAHFSLYLFPPIFSFMIRVLSSSGVATMTMTMSSANFKWDSFVQYIHIL